jgi:hypothetical protein
LVFCIGVVSKITPHRPLEMGISGGIISKEKVKQEIEKTRRNVKEKENGKTKII